MANPEPPQTISSAKHGSPANNDNLLSVKSDVIQALYVSNSNFWNKQLWDLDVFLFHCQI